MTSKLRITPLGGLSEIGKNLTVIEYANDIIVVDCGSIFPTDDMPGIDLVIPDMDYLVKNSHKIRGFVITHGHEDHIGALPYALRSFPKVPVFASKLAIALIAYKLEEHKNKDAQLQVVNAGDIIKLGVFEVEFIHTNHSIAGAFALGINTPIGSIIHTGDFKIDHTPVDGGVIDFLKLGEYASKGVLLLMSDSTNAEIPGYTMSERLVGNTFEEYFKEANGRVIVASFASNVHRVQQICDVAFRHGRKICFQGRSMVNVSNLAIELGYLKLDPANVIDLNDVDNYAENEVCLITTGSQGEPMSGLTRMATDNHKFIVKKGDMVIISASAIPGNEKSVSQVIDKLFQKGAYVVYESIADIHTSGHAKQEELKMILSLIKPKFFIPVHGEYRHMMNHMMLAEAQGIASENCFVLCNGDAVEIFNNKARKIDEHTVAGAIMIDGSGVGDIGSIVLRDRRRLSQDGLFNVVLSIDKKTGKVLAGPEIISRGFVYVKESEELMNEARNRIKKVARQFEQKNKSDWAGINNQIKSVLRNYLYDQTKRTPVLLVFVLES